MLLDLVCSGLKIIEVCEPPKLSLCLDVLLIKGNFRSYSGDKINEILHSIANDLSLHSFEMVLPRYQTGFLTPMQ